MAEHQEIYAIYYWYDTRNHYNDIEVSLADEDEIGCALFSKREDAEAKLAELNRGIKDRREGARQEQADRNMQAEVDFYVRNKESHEKMRAEHEALVKAGLREGEFKKPKFTPPTGGDWWERKPEYGYEINVLKIKVN